MPFLLHQYTVCLYRNRILDKPDDVPPCFHRLVIHGGGGDITINVTPAEIQCELVDHGPGIADVGLAMQEGYSTATDAIREMGFGAGMGLPNIQRNSDHMEIHTVPGEGTTVKIMIKIG